MPLPSKLKFLMSLLCLALATHARAQQDSKSQVTVSPNGQCQILTTIEWNGSELPLEKVVLKRGDNVLWQYAARTGLPFNFSWSPSSQFILFSRMELDHTQTLWALRFAPDHPDCVLNTSIDLTALEQRLNNSLPDEHDTIERHSGITAIRWSGNKALVVFATHGMGKYGVADFSLNFNEWPPVMKVTKLRPSHTKAKPAKA